MGCEYYLVSCTSQTLSWTLCLAIWSEIIRVISQSNECAAQILLDHKYDFRLRLHDTKCNYHCLKKELVNEIWYILNLWKYFLYLFLTYSMVLKDKCNHCNLRPVLERRRSNLMYVVVWSLSRIWMAALVLLQQLWPNALQRYMCFSLRYTTLLLYTQLCFKSTFQGKSKLTNRECCMVNLLSWSLNGGQFN